MYEPFRTKIFDKHTFEWFGLIAKGFLLRCMKCFGHEMTLKNVDDGSLQLFDAGLKETS